MTGESAAFERVHRSFLELEAEFDAFDLRVDGIPVWERVRFDVHQRLLRQMDVFPESAPSGSLSLRDYLAGLGLWAQNLVRKNPLLADHHEYLFYGHQRRKRLADGYCWDLYCDPLYDALDFEYVHLEEPHEYAHCTPAKTDTIRYLDLVQYTGTMLRKTGLVDVSLPADERGRIADLEQALESRFGVSLDMTGLVSHKLARRHAVKWLYDRLLARIDPAVAVVVVSYGRETFVEACQDQGIPVVELQHGVVHEYHYGYHFPGERTKETFPDYFLSFGEFWNDQVDFPIPEANVHPVGYPYLESRAESYADVEAREQVVFVGQQSIGEPLSEIAVAAADRLDHDVVYKLHPKEYDNWERTYPHLRDSSVTVVDGDDPPLYQLFAESTVQVGVGSTAIYEGLQFGLATYAVELPSVQYLRPLVDVGFATKVGGADELLDAVEAGTQKPVDATQLFADGAVKNFETALARIKNETR